MPISRRTFVRSGGLWVAAAALGVDLLGCKETSTSSGRAVGSGDVARTAPVPTAAVPTAPAPSGEPPPYGYASAQPPAPATAAARCGTTAPNIEGPYYRAGAPSRADLADAGMKGTRLVLSGRVLADDCKTPLEGAVLDLWQADAEGRYDNDGHTGRKSGPLVLRGKLASRTDGTYEVKSIIPGRYLNGAQYRPAHIHVKVSAPGFRPLTTQLYFDGDPYNDVDPFIDKSLVMKLRGTSAKAADFDFVLQRG